MYIRLYTKVSQMIIKRRCPLVRFMHFRPKSYFNDARTNRKCFYINSWRIEAGVNRFRKHTSTDNDSNLLLMLIIISFKKIFNLIQ